MAAVGAFKHNSLVNESFAIDATYDVGTAHIHEVKSPQSTKTNVILDGIFIRVEGIAGGATKLTMRLCWDVDGDYTVCPDTEATISTGLTTTDCGHVTYAFQLPIYAPSVTDKNLYLFVKTDTGTANLALSQLTFHE